VTATRKTQHGERVCERLDGLADWIHEHAQDLAQEAEDAKIVDFAVCLSQRSSTMNVLRGVMKNASEGTRCAQGYLWMWVYGDEPVE
jgi:hypothetical protein